MQLKSAKRVNLDLDKAGAVASLTCAIHCAVLPLAMTLLPLGRISEERHFGIWAVGVIAMGGCTVAASHLLNRRLCHTCRRCREEHPGKHH